MSRHARQGVQFRKYRGSPCPQRADGVPQRRRNILVLQQNRPAATRLDGREPVPQYVACTPRRLFKRSSSEALQRLRETERIHRRSLHVLRQQRDPLRVPQHPVVLRRPQPRSTRDDPGLGNERLPLPIRVVPDVLHTWDETLHDPPVRGDPHPAVRLPRAGRERLPIWFRDEVHHPDLTPWCHHG